MNTGCHIATGGNCGGNCVCYPEQNSNKEHPKGLEVVHNAWFDPRWGSVTLGKDRDAKAMGGNQLVTLTNAQAYAEQRVKEAIEEVILACENERVEEIAEEDVAYNTAIKHVVEAIRALGEKK